MQVPGPSQSKRSYLHHFFPPLHSSKGCASPSSSTLSTKLFDGLSTVVLASPTVVVAAAVPLCTGNFVVPFEGGDMESEGGA